MSSDKYHSGTCGPCILCEKPSQKYTHTDKLTEHEYSFLCKVEDHTFDKGSCICLACSKQLRRNVDNPKFQPRWLKREKTYEKCVIHRCKNTAHRKTTLASTDEIVQLIGEPIVQFTVSGETSTVSLCQEHYNVMYKKLKASTPCDACGGTPKKGERFNRHCPEPCYIPGSRWLLSRILQYFEGILEIHCRQRRVGTLLFHKDCDLLQAMSIIMGRTTSLQTKEVTQEQSQLSALPDTGTCNEEQIQTVAKYLNSRLHQKARVLNTKFEGEPELIAGIDLTNAITDTDDVVTDFLTTMTQSIRSSRHSLLQDKLTEVSSKKIRLIYATSLLLFYTKSTCSAPFHVALTEAVLCHELVRILNRSGLIASLDTVNRVATHVVQRRISNGIECDLKPQKLAAVSIDNIDILQPYGFVSCQDATRSWHGTSVQCVQPLPTSGNMTDDDIRASPRTEVTSGKHRLSSPAKTPTPNKKLKRRRRTLTELPSPPSESTEIEVDSTSEPFEPINFDDYKPSKNYLRLEDFKVDDDEQFALNQLHQNLFRAVVLRFFAPDQHCFPSLPSFINCLQKQSSDKEVSNVTYVEIVSERADSKPTLIGVIARLQKTFVQKLKQKYVIVVGDAKTYNLLQAICYEYKTQLKWLIPFPGD